MVDEVTRHARWTGTFHDVSPVWTIARAELRRAWFDPWARMVLVVASVIAVVLVGVVSQASRSVQDPSLLLVSVLEFSRWGALAIAAVMAGPALLDDARGGALEMYRARGIGRLSHLVGKSLAVTVATFAAAFLPAAVYFGLSWFILDTRPEGWASLIGGVAGYAAIWTLLASGLGLGLSCLARSGRAATLILLGTVAGADIVLKNLITAITQEPRLAVLSPFAAMSAQLGWLMDRPVSDAFPYEWGLVEIVGLAVVGWIFVATRHPRIRGED